MGTMILLYLLGTLNGSESERREQTPASYSQSAQADAERTCAGREGAAIFECVYERVEASQEQARGEQDLSAQQRAATSALASAVISLLTLVISIVGVWFVKQTLDATLEAVEDTGRATDAMIRQNELAEAAQRAWLDVIPTIEVTAIDERFCAVKTECSVMNVGQSVARDVDVVSMLATGANAIAEYNRIFREMIERAKSGGSPINIFPSKRAHFGGSYTNCFNSDLVEWDERGRTTFFFITVVMYRTASGEICWSRCLWRLSQNRHPIGETYLSWDEFRRGGIVVHEPTSMQDYR